MTRAMGIAMTAAPSTWNVPPRPANFAEPETSSASRAPTAIPAERPTPPSTCDPTSVRTVRRWIASGGAWVVTRVSMPVAADARARSRRLSAVSPPS